MPGPREQKSDHCAEKHSNEKADDEGENGIHEASVTAGSDTAGTRRHERTISEVQTTASVRIPRRVSLPGSLGIGLKPSRA